jgi:fimbrial chaperone protein
MLQRSIFSLKAAALLATLLCAAGAIARSATFSVDPIQIVLARGNSSESIAITNQSAQKLRLQVSGFSWNQSAGGEMKLAPTDDLVFFPQLLELDPGETKRIRVGVTADSGPMEKTYRVFMEELPSLESVIAPRQSTVTLRMKIGVPVFVKPTGTPALSGVVRDAAASDGALSFDVVNSGNTHFAVQTVHVVGKDASGSTIVSHDLSGWYVLAGGTRRFSVPLSKNDCEALRTLAVQVRTDAVNFSNSFSDFSKQCGAVSRP